LQNFKERPNIGQQGTADAHCLRGMITLEVITLLH